MSEINWNQLASVHFPEAKVVGKTQSSDIGGKILGSNFGDTILKGYETGKRGKLLDAQTALVNTHNSQQQLILKSMQQKMQDEATLRQHFNDTEQNYINTLKSTYGPVAVMQYNEAKNKAAQAASDAVDSEAKSEKDVNAAIMSNNQAFGNAANIAHSQQIFTQNKFLQQHGVQFNQSGQPVGNIDPRLMQAAKQQGLMAGQAAWNFQTSQMTPRQQQSLKDHGPMPGTSFMQWNELTDSTMHNQGNQYLLSVAAQSEAKNAGKENKPTTQIQNARYMAGLKQAIDNNTATPEQKDIYNNMLAEQKGNKNTPSLLLSQSGQKAFTANQGMYDTLDDSIHQLNLVDGQLNDLKIAMGPGVGHITSQITAQGQALNANLNTLVLNAPALLGLPATALRIATLWKIIQSTKPSPQQFIPAAKAIVADLKYMGALKQEQVWKREAESMKALQRVNPDEANQWFKDHPDPIKTNPKPDLTNLYKLFPDMKKMDLEKDWETVQTSSSQQQSQQANNIQQSSQQPSQIQEGTTKTLDGVSYTFKNGKWYK